MEKFNLEDIMKDIEDGMFDDLINAEIEENTKQMYEAGTKEYMDWVMDKLNKSESNSIFDDEDIEEKDKLALLPSLYSFLMNVFGLEPKHIEDKDGFEKSTIYFKYKTQVLEIIQSFCDNGIITGIAKSTFKGEVEELMF